MSGKKLLGKLKQYSIVKSLDMYACKIQNWKFWFGANYCLSCWFKKTQLQSLQ